MLTEAQIADLKKVAKKLKKSKGIPHIQALDELAQERGFKTWERMVDKTKRETAAGKELPR